MFIADNKKDFLTNAYVHGLDTRNKNHLYLPLVSLSCVQKRSFILWSQNL